MRTGLRRAAAPLRLLALAVPAALPAQAVGVGVGIRGRDAHRVGQADFYFPGRDCAKC